jgi:hypothetical protein
MKPIVSFLIPLCSRNLNVVDFKSTTFYKQVIPQFKKTIEPDLYEYRMYIGIDDDDDFFLRYQDDMKHLFDNMKGGGTPEGCLPPSITIVILKACQHRPVRAWNILFERAYNAGSDFFLQIGDDVIIETPGWTSVFVERLKKQDNIGTIAPCEPVNYNLRKNQNSLIINENNFVHRTHYEIFEYFFQPEILNWYCDNWITCVYDERAYMCQQIICKNLIRDSRYAIHQCQNLMRYIIEGKEKVSKYIRKKNINKKTLF